MTSSPLPLAFVHPAFASAIARPSTPLNGLGLTILIVAVTGILTLVCWCYWRILRTPHDPNV